MREIQLRGRGLLRRGWNVQAYWTAGCCLGDCGRVKGLGDRKIRIHQFGVGGCGETSEKIVSVVRRVNPAD